MRDNIEEGSNGLHRCAAFVQRPEADDYEHQFINHAEAYAKGNVHTNGLEWYWSLLKRALVVPTCGSNRFICFVTSMSKRSDSTTAC